MTKKLRRRFRKERGAALLWLTGSMVILLAFSALAVDLAWIYVNSSRLQNAADAAALAGVINIPAFPDRARSDAADAAAANGFPVGTDVSLASTPLGDHSLEVTLRTSTPTYFLKALGIRQFQITRTSTAQYVKPVPMGSPSSCFGIGSLNNAEGCAVSAEQNFWAAVNSRFTARHHGDPYLTQCDWGESDFAACVDSIDNGRDPWDTNASSLNSEYRPSGYYYAIEVPEGKTSIEVAIFDAGFSAGSRAGDIDGADLVNSPEGGPDMVYQLYDVDTTPLNPYDNPPIAGCRKEIASPAPVYRDRWATLCTIVDPNPGIYVLNVRHATGSSGGGNNGYGLNVIVEPAGSPSVRLYGINDISIFTNQPDATGNLTLAEVAPEHAGKVLELSFFDPGEDDQDAHMTVLMPDGSTADCRWVARNQDGLVTSSGGPGACTIQTADESLPTTSKSLFNGQWVTATIDIPDGYTCSSDCWWSVRIDLHQPHDRTTWAARIIGNPVRLIPNR
jgi:hypothetical protein